MDKKEYFEFGQSLYKIKENLEWRKQRLASSLKSFKESQQLSFEEVKTKGLLAPFTWHDFIDVECSTDISEGPVLDCTFQDLDGNYIKRVSPSMMENGKKRILRVYEFGLTLLDEQILEVESELLKLEQHDKA